MNINAVYRERNLILALLTVISNSECVCYRSLHDINDPNWDSDWRNIIYVILPNGVQLSWHIHDSELVYFSHLSLGYNEWDGHTTEEKYDRIISYLKGCQS